MPDEATPTRKRGRPTKYTPKLGASICKRMALGESVRSICTDPKMPNRDTVLAWAFDPFPSDDARAEFSGQYARAMLMRAELYAEDIIEIADEAGLDVEIDEKGKVTVKGEILERAKIRIDVRKWYASKLVPKYADKLVHEGGETPIKTEDVSRDPEHLTDLARRIAFILNGAVHEREKRHGR